MPKKEPIETRPSEETGERVATSGIELLAGWNHSLADFYARRLRKYWKFPFELAEKRSLDGLAQSLLEFQKELLRDYADEADELQRIAHRPRRKWDAKPSQDYERRLLDAQRDAASIIEQAKMQAERIVTSAQSRADRVTGEAEAAPEAVRKRA